MEEQLSSGLEILRAALYVRDKKTNLAGLAQDSSISAQLLESFIHGKAILPVTVVQALVKDVFNGHLVFDAQEDKLMPAPQPPVKRMGPGASKDPTALNLPSKSKVGNVTLPHQKRVTKPGLRERFT